MEHRWGQRNTVDVPVHLACDPYGRRRGRLMNVSVSGAFVATRLGLPLLAGVQVEIELPGEAPLLLGAYVVRRGVGGFGLEWNELLTHTLAYAFAKMRTGLMRSNLVPRNNGETLRNGSGNSSPGRDQGSRPCL